MRIRKKTLAGIAVIACVFLINACVAVKHNPNIHSPDRTRTQSTSSVHYWYYYPETRVYYHIKQRHYYYPVGGNWRKADKLPPGWAINKKNRVRLKMVGKPYLRNAYHKHKYPTKKMAVNKPGGKKPGHKKDKLYSGNRKNLHRHPGTHAEKRVTPRKPDHAAKRGVGNKHQPPGHARADKRSHPGHRNSGAVPGRSHKGERHAKQSQIHRHKPRNNKQDVGRGKSAVKQPHANKRHVKVGEQVKKDRRLNTVHVKAKKTGKGNGKLDHSSSADNKQGRPNGRSTSKTTQRPPKQHESGQSGKKQQKKRNIVKANKPGQEHANQEFSISKGSKGRHATVNSKE